MSRTHELKTWPEMFAAVLSGEKTFEYRKDDRGFMVGDILKLMHWDPAQYSSDVFPRGGYVKVPGSTISVECIHAEVTQILHGGRFGVPESYCVMSIRVLNDRKDPTE